MWYQNFIKFEKTFFQNFKGSPLSKKKLANFFIQFFKNFFLFWGPHVHINWKKIVIPCSYCIIPSNLILHIQGVSLILEVTKPQFHHEILTFLIIFSHQSYAIDGSGKYIKFYKIWKTFFKIFQRVPPVKILKNQNIFWEKILALFQRVPPLVFIGEKVEKSQILDCSAKSEF